VGDVRSRADPALSADSKEAARERGGIGSANIECETRLRELLHTITNNPRLSSVMRAFATLHVRWRAWRFADSRLIMVGWHRRQACRPGPVAR
jgi:hypothetical protein